MKHRSFVLNFFAGTVGNLFEHYDKYLFGFLAPFLAPLFFKNSSPLTALILTYGIMPLGLLSRPIGALFFGKMGDRRGRKTALFWTLIGMAITTFLIGCLPTHEKVGILAPILLALFRLIQNFFAAGEVTGGALLILESCDPKKRSFFSSLYDCSCILGILIASFAVMFLSQQGLVEKYWRVLYWAGASTALIGLGIRLFIQESPPAAPEKENISTRQLIWNYRHVFLALVLVTGFSHAVYETVTSLMNGYLPLVSGLTKADSIQVNTWILVLDFFLLPFFGLLAMKLSKKFVMLFFAFMTIVFAFPLFGLLQGANMVQMTVIRIVFVILGVGFSAPLHAWAQEVTPLRHRYTLMSLGVAIGGQLIGGGTSALNLWIYQQTGWVLSPAFYLTTLAALAGTAILLTAPSRERQLALV